MSLLVASSSGLKALGLNYEDGLSKLKDSSEFSRGLLVLDIDPIIL